MNFTEEVLIRDFITSVSLDAKIRFNYLIELGNTTSGWTTGDDVHTRTKGGLLCSVSVCVWNNTLQETFPDCRVSKCVCM